MRTLIDFLAIAIFSLITLQGGKDGLKKVHDYVQRLALEKAVQGLGSLEKTTQAMTGEKLDF